MSSIKDTTSTSDIKNKIIPGTLYLVATPIGNLADISERALKVLREVSFIAAEDTRNTALMLSRFGIKKELISYFEHNKRQRGEIIAGRLATGDSCALVTDAGTPAISDPGEDIVRLCEERGITVTGVPGCCALIDALSLSGLSTGRFTFEGFLSTAKGERKKHLDEISHERRTMIFYEAPHKIRTTLSDLAAVFGEDRKITLCRELTKLNEDVIRTTVGQAIQIYSQKEPRGEYVLILEGEAEYSGGKTQNNADPRLLALSPTEHVAYYMKDGKMQRMDAIKAAAHDREMSKSDFYRLMNKEEI